MTSQVSLLKLRGNVAETRVTGLAGPATERVAVMRQVPGDVILVRGVGDAEARGYLGCLT